MWLVTLHQSYSDICEDSVVWNRGLALCGWLHYTSYSDICEDSVVWNRGLALCGWLHYTKVILTSVKILSSGTEG